MMAAERQISKRLDDGQNEYDLRGVHGEMYEARSRRNYPREDQIGSKEKCSSSQRMPPSRKESQSLGVDQRREYHISDSIPELADGGIPERSHAAKRREMTGIWTFSKYWEYISLSSDRTGSHE
ncbi:MAG: hypothetical protein ACLVBB_05550 [Dysosmobacter welbionis]